MSENRIFVMEPAEVLATCGIALAEGDAVKEALKGTLSNTGEDKKPAADDSAPLTANPSRVN